MISYFPVEYNFREFHNFKKSQKLWASTRVWSRAMAMLCPGVRMDNYEYLCSLQLDDPLSDLVHALLGYSCTFLL